MTQQEAIDWLEGRKEHWEMSDEGQELAQALDVGIDTMRKYQKIEQIIKEHDADRMPEDYWYIDRIREVVEDGNND